MNTTLTCAFAQWSPGLGDNSVIGWLTVVVYLVAAFTSARAARALTGQQGLAWREQVFWWSVSAILLFLAVNKQLDLQSLGTMVGRCHSLLAGWYENRRTVQRGVVLAIAVAAIALLGITTLTLRGVLGRIWPAMLGLAFVCLFVVVRAASFHQVDALLGTWRMGIKMNWILELPGPTLVALVALLRRRTILRG